MIDDEIPFFAFFLALFALKNFKRKGREVFRKGPKKYCS